jgi:hypothetical protein
MNNGSIICDTPPNTHIYTLAHHANHDVLHYIIKKGLDYGHLAQQPMVNICQLAMVHLIFSQLHLQRRWKFSK